MPHPFIRPLRNLLILLPAAQLFPGKMFPQTAVHRKFFPSVCQILKHRFLHHEINLFLTGKNVLVVMVPILINTDVCDPSYNDLKFIVRNRNYFCTNLRIFIGKR